MSHYLVRARPKPALVGELHRRLRGGEFLPLHPFGHSLTVGLEGARADATSGHAVWEEEDYCSPPLAMERDAVLDRYFDGLEVERVQKGGGWRQIEHLPSLWPDGGDRPGEDTSPG